MICVLVFYARNSVNSLFALSFVVSGMELFKQQFKYVVLLPAVVGDSSFLFMAGNLCSVDELRTGQLKDSNQKKDYKT